MKVIKSMENRIILIKKTTRKITNQAGGFSRKWCRRCNKVFHYWRSDKTVLNLSKGTVKVI